MIMFEKKRLTMLREERGLSKRQFAKIIKKPRESVIQWENGSCCPQVPTLAFISSVLDVPVGYFFVEKLACEQTTNKG